MNVSTRMILIVAVLLVCVGCDQATKSIAVKRLSGTAPISFMGDTVRLQLAYNSGAFLSLGASLPEGWRQGLLTVGTGLSLIGVLAMALFSAAGCRREVLALALFCAGGVGNLIDRVAHGGLVVDFMNVGLGPIRTGIFNVADLAIMTGMLILFLSAFKRLKTDCKNPLRQPVAITEEDRP